MSNYKNILKVQTNEYNKIYKNICKDKPSMSIKDKKTLTLRSMVANRNLNVFDLYSIVNIPFTKEFQYAMEVVAINTDMEEGITRYYLKDDSLFDFFQEY